MDSVIHAFAGAGVVATGYFIWQVIRFITDWSFNRWETKEALANDAERAKEQEIEDRLIAIVKDLLERKALPAPTPEAK